MTESPISVIVGAVSGVITETFLSIKFERPNLVVVYLTVYTPKTVLSMLLVMTIVSFELSEVHPSSAYGEPKIISTVEAPVSVSMGLKYCCVVVSATLDPYDVFEGSETP